MKTRICKSCGLRFVQKEKSTAKYCSDRCRRLSRSQNPNKNYRQGVYLAKSGRREVYQSSWEESTMKKWDQLGLNWRRATGIKIPYFDPTTKRHRIYLPDFILKTTKGNYLIEQKPLPLVYLPTNQAKFVAARAWAKKNNYQFHIITSPGATEGLP